MIKTCIFHRPHTKMPGFLDKRPIYLPSQKLLPVTLRWTTSDTCKLKITITTKQTHPLTTFRSALQSTPATRISKKSSTVTCTIHSLWTSALVEVTICFTTRCHSWPLARCHCIHQLHQSLCYSQCPIRWCLTPSSLWIYPLRRAFSRTNKCRIFSNSRFRVISCKLKCSRRRC